PERPRAGRAAGADRRARGASARAGERVSRLLASLDASPSGRARPVWFDAVAYGRARLLGGGDVPWQAPAELTSFFGKTQAMFGSDAILADIADLFEQRAAADQALRTAMAARSRPGYALRTLLGDERARAGPVAGRRGGAGPSGRGSARRRPGRNRGHVQCGLPAHIQRQRSRRAAARRGLGTGGRAYRPRSLPAGGQRGRALRLAGGDPHRGGRGLAARANPRRRGLDRLVRGPPAGGPLGRRGRP